MSDGFRPSAKPTSVSGTPTSPDVAEVFSESESVMAACDCAGCCTIVRIDRHDWAEPPVSAFVEFYTQTSGKGTLRWRLKNAWSVMRGTDHHYHDCVSLNRESQRLLGEFLLRAAEAGAVTPDGGRQAGVGPPSVSVSGNLGAGPQ